MDTGTRFGIAIGLLLVSMILYFFAFHPNGVADDTGNAVKNPDGMVEWLMEHFYTTTTGNSEIPASGGN